MTEMITVTDGEDLAAKTQRRLAKAERRNEKLRNRLKRMQLFEDHEYTDYKGEKKSVPKAKRAATDEPQVQMMLARRDRYEACIATVEEFKKQLGMEEDPKGRLDLLKQIASIEQLADKHAAAIERMLGSMMFVDAKVNGSRSALLTRAAGMAMRDRHHQDIIAIRRKENPENLSEAEILKIINGEES